MLYRYVIYGSRKSGKSVLLRVLLGLTKPTYGCIHYNMNVVYDKPKFVKLGYMPQSDAMYMDCTVHENIIFFGKLNNFTDVQIDQVFNSYCYFLWFHWVTKLDSYYFLRRFQKCLSL